MISAWEIATKEERHEMLQIMLDAVYIGMTTKEVVGQRPKTAFLPLLNLDEPVKARALILRSAIFSELGMRPLMERVLSRPEILK